MSWGRRVILLVVAGLGATFLAIALSAALARPASAATLPVPEIPALPAPALPAAISVPLINDPPGTVSGVVGDVAEPLAPLPGQLPIVHLPIPQFPISISPVTGALTTGFTPAGTTTDAPAPGIGGSAHGSAGTHSGSTVRNTGSRFRRSGGQDSSGSNASGTAQKVPSHRSPSPSLPLIPSGTGEASSPGHWGSTGSAFPLMILLLGALGLGGVFLRRRLSPRLLFDSRFAPPG